MNAPVPAPERTDLETAISDALTLAAASLTIEEYAAAVAKHLLGLGYPAKPEDTILVDAALDMDPEIALDAALARWGRTAIPGHDLKGVVVAAEFLDAHESQARVIAYKPDYAMSPFHAYGILLRSAETIR